MLAAAGIRVEWIAGSPKPDAPGRLVIGVRLTGAAFPDNRPGVLARTYPFGVGVRGITVFEDRVRAVAEVSVVEEYRLLAHVLVHEIGHLLERQHRHSDMGVMKARWSLKDLRDMNQKLLPFAEEDILLMHQGLEEAGYKP
jgi:hypothetical protein